jgi:hypothetical protein
VWSDIAEHPQHLVGGIERDHRRAYLVCVTAGTGTRIEAERASRDKRAKGESSIATHGLAARCPLLAVLLITIDGAALHAGEVTAGRARRRAV